MNFLGACKPTAGKTPGTGSNRHSCDLSLVAEEPPNFGRYLNTTQCQDHTIPGHHYTNEEPAADSCDTLAAVYTHEVRYAPTWVTRGSNFGGCLHARSQVRSYLGYTWLKPFPETVCTTTSGMQSRTMQCVNILAGPITRDPTCPLCCLHIGDPGSQYTHGSRRAGTHA